MEEQLKEAEALAEVHKSAQEAAEAFPKSADIQAVEYIKEHLPKYAKMVDGFPGSAAGLKRVLAAVAYTPFNERPFEFSYPHEQELFEAAREIENCKLTLFHIGMEQAKSSTNVVETSVNTEETSAVAEHTGESPNSVNTEETKEEVHG